MLWNSAHYANFKVISEPDSILQDYLAHCKTGKNYNCRFADIFANTQCYDGWNIHLGFLIKSVSGLWLKEKYGEKAIDSFYY